MNRKKHRGLSKFKGVSKSPKKWRGFIHTNGKRYDLGYFDTEEQAAKAYDTKALELFGEFARLNFPENNLAQPSHHQSK